MFFFTCYLMFMVGCTHPPVSGEPAGQLFIIGGGHRPDSLMTEMVHLSNMKPNDLALIVAWASEIPDSAAAGVSRQLRMAGLGNVHALQAPKKDHLVCTADSLAKASLVFFTGGSQMRLMEIASLPVIREAIHRCYHQGGMIAGTSAGAAVMSALMITGNEAKHPVYTGEYRTIESDNIELAAGLGLLHLSIIDQHFIYRMRMNRLMAVAMENPGLLAIGIDESTALHVSAGKGQVIGRSQVITIRADPQTLSKSRGLLGNRNMQVGIYLPGEYLHCKVE